MNIAVEPAERPDEVEWDVVVIGTGMGGATTGYQLAKLGHRVLFIEKGIFLHGKTSSDAPATSAAVAGNAEEDPHARLEKGWWPLRLRGETSFGEVEFFAPLGCGSGGTTSLYGAGLERLFPSDFQPKANFPGVEDSTLPDKWPISYSELQPYYDQAEKLFRVRGTADPLRADVPNLLEPPPLSPRDQSVFNSFNRIGLHPYRHHVGFEFVKGCDECLLKMCPRQCKSDAGRLCLLPAIESHGAKLLSECEVLRLDSEGSEIQTVRCRWKQQEIAIRAKVVGLAAGAFNSPVILLNSKSKDWPEGLANRSGMVGRNLMFHASDFYAMKPLNRLSDTGPKKTMALNDFYQVDGEKLGIFQSVGVGASVSLAEIMQFMRDVAERDPAWWKKLASPRPLWWRKVSSPAIRLVALIAYHIFDFKHAVMWSSIIEDLPYYHNRVMPDPQSKSGMRFEYHYPEELKVRVRSFRKRLAKGLGPHRVMNLTGDNNINYGHVCGTCRFGDDPKTSVLDKTNRAHDVSNLYVVDASFFPSSGGVNPTLTIAANALRVAEAIHQRLS